MKDDELKNALPDDAELDAALAQMADEVPPVPADFHSRWMNAVRADAEKAASEEKTPVAKNNPAAAIRWMRILSVAAAFVFLIGGTLLYRNTRQSLSAPYSAEKREAAESAPLAAAGALPDAEEQIRTDTEEDGTGESVMMDTYLQAAEESFAETEAADEEMSMKAAGFSRNSLAAAPAAGTVAESAEQADYMAEAAAYDSGAVTETAAEASAPTSEPTAVPTATQAPAPTAEQLPAEAPEAETESEAEPGFLQAAGAFLTDMGDFLLAALPYLLVLAVPAATALIIRRRKTRKP